MLGGAQVRRGDACGQTRPCAAVEEYVAAAVRMAEYAGTALVFLASDDPDTVLEVSRAAHPPTRDTLRVLLRFLLATRGRAFVSLTSFCTPHSITHCSSADGRAVVGLALTLRCPVACCRAAAVRCDCAQLR